jgi:sorbitol-specific phosphotransferase system component IIBC
LIWVIIGATTLDVFPSVSRSVPTTFVRMQPGAVISAHYALQMLTAVETMVAIAAAPAGMIYSTASTPDIGVTGVSIAAYLTAVPSVLQAHTLRAVQGHSA